ncbi:MAG: hypothetical protein PW789_03625 [Edaphobacter sp.]|uniref:hypothetical protein n=1 Tax=Edaphobacter sp. TaxID=1934404 RepID=UPI002383FD28|nr:hypothetical protein [Edaphobacter sp.]MDE1175676.1 hypothetical protein [Edaphobacter sp.]
MSTTLPFRKIYAAPFILAIITAYGLLSALLGDGLWDALSWIALAIPIAVLAICISRGKQVRGAMTR